jgi:hypothetical protein
MGAPAIHVFSVTAAPTCLVGIFQWKESGKSPVMSVTSDRDSNNCPTKAKQVAAFSISFSVILKKTDETGSNVRKKTPYNGIYFMKLHFRNILLILPKPINDAPITHDTKADLKNIFRNGGL